MAKKKSSAKKTAKAVAKKSPVKKSPAKKTSTKKPAAKKIAKPAKKVVAKKAAPKKTAPKKALAKKTAAKKSVVKKTAPVVKKAAAVKAAPKAPAMKAVPAKAVKALDLSNFVTPLDDRLLVQLSEKERMTAGGLYIPDTVADVSGNLHGVIVSVGRGRMDKKGHIHPLDVKLGDRIVFAQYSGSKIEIQNENLLILRESEVLGVVSK
jgi:chaperonin GroES